MLRIRVLPVPESVSTSGCFIDMGDAKVVQPRSKRDSFARLPSIQNSIGMLFKVLPSGSYLKGSPRSDYGLSGYLPQCSVTIAASFSLGVHEVTQSQYESVMGINPSYCKGPDNPVEHVSWDDAVAFCRKLSDLPAEKSAGRVYRLPTQVEWEYACRAGSTTRYCFGDNAKDLGEYAWFDKNSGNTTHAVGGKKPNGWGLYDMHGNVYEWCSNGYGGQVSVGAGGSSHRSASLCQSTSRRDNQLLGAAWGLGDDGFRLALSSPSVQSPEAAQDK